MNISKMVSSSCCCPPTEKHWESTNPAFSISTKSRYSWVTRYVLITFRPVEIWGKWLMVTRVAENVRKSTKSCSHISQNSFLLSKGMFTNNQHLGDYRRVIVFCPFFLKMQQNSHAPSPLLPFRALSSLPLSSLFFSEFLISELKAYGHIQVPLNLLMFTQIPNHNSMSSWGGIFFHVQFLHLVANLRLNPGMWDWVQIPWTHTPPLEGAHLLPGEPPKDVESSIQSPHRWHYTALFATTTTNQDQIDMPRSKPEGHTCCRKWKTELMVSTKLEQNWKSANKNHRSLITAFLLHRLCKNTQFSKRRLLFFKGLESAWFLSLDKELTESDKRPNSLHSLLCI